MHGAAQVFGGARALGAAKSVSFKKKPDSVRFKIILKKGFKLTQFSSHTSSSNLAGHGRASGLLTPGSGSQRQRLSESERGGAHCHSVTGSHCSAQQIRSAAHVVAWVRATGTEHTAAPRENVEKPGGVHHVRQLPIQTLSPVVEDEKHLCPGSHELDPRRCTWMDLVSLELLLVPSEYLSSFVA